MVSLHTFAHYGEAQSFREFFAAKPCSDLPFEGLFKSENDFILVTGEGKHNATFAVSAVVAKYHQEIDRIFNWGVAGSLNSKLQEGAILEVRTAYAQRTHSQFFFQSFQTASKSAQIDCVSATDRVLEPEMAEHLSCVASLVDRELWAVASVAKKFKKPLYAFKIVSDQAGTPACEMVKDKAVQWSQALLAKFHQLAYERDESGRTDRVSAFLGKGFYVTQSQKQRLEKLLSFYEDRLSDPFTPEKAAKEAFQSREEFDALHPKKRTVHLIDYIQNKLQPLRYQVKRDIEQLLPKANGRLMVHVDPELEKIELDVRFKASSSKELKKAIKQLKEIEFKAYEKLMRGENLEI